MIRYLLYVSYKYGFPILEPLEEEILKRGDEVCWFAEISDNKKFIKNQERVIHSVDSVKEYKPDIVLTASNEVPHFFPGIKVQVFHGFSINKRNEDKGHFRIRGMFDLYCTQGPSTTIKFKKLAEKYKHFDVVETGWSKVDVLFPIEKVVNKRPKVFLASTFTKSLSLAYDDAFFNEVERLIKLNHWDWLITLHPKMNQEIVSKFKMLSKYPNVTFLDYLKDLSPLKQADVLITDTTSIITEFVIQCKPVVTFKNNMPKAHMLNILSEKDLEESCKIAIERPKRIIKEIIKFTDQEHPYFDGKSSERVINAVSDFYQNDKSKKLKRKPLNLIRKFKIRKKLNYFK